MSATGDVATEAPAVPPGMLPAVLAPGDDSIGDWVPRQKFDYAAYTTKEEVPRGQPSGTWLAGAERYEWKEEYGDVAPRDERLEKQLFGEEGDEPSGTGLDFRKLLKVHADVVGPINPTPIKKFEDAPLHPVMVENIALCKYETPTPIQRMCIPTILAGHDMIAVSQTGSGKTAAFLIPILSKLMGKAKKLAAPRPPAGMPAALGTYVAEPLVLIVAPTRELVTQIFDECRRFCYRSMLRPCAVYGGADTLTQRLELAKGCDILVGTPGRLIDFMERGRVLSLKRIKYVVVDEADEMMDMGFEPQLRRIIEMSDCNQDDDRMCMMFSATFPKAIRKLAQEFLADDHILVKIGRIGSTNENVTQNVVFVENTAKKQALFDVLCSSPPSRTLIFANHKRTVDDLDDFLYNLKLPTTSIHGARTQREREDALIAFRSGKCPIMIATGIAARGLDIKNVMHVINYDMVQNIDEYIHRIGRTARIGNRGLATTFWNDSNSDIAEDLVKVLMECNQTVPEFLEYAKPEGELKWDEEESEPDDNGGDVPAAADDSWGAPEPAAASGGGSGWDVGVEPAAAEKSTGGGWSW